MKKYLLPNSGTFYKANLHCHSVLSDGHWTPEEIKSNYMAKGYSVIAYTDHDRFYTHNELSDADFLALNGYELGIGERGVSRISPKTCHLCLIALDEGRTEEKNYYDSVLTANEQADRTVNRHTPEIINHIIKEAKADGFFVTYNHPVWSLEADGDYMNYHGMHAMEITNYASIVEGYDDHDATIYDNMLRGGERIFCVSTDDNHDKYPMSHPKHDSFGGFTFIKAKELSYSAITDALLKGNFYASEGPEIYELYYENGNVFIKTSDAVRIVLATDARRNQRVVGEKIGDTINEAVFSIDAKSGEFFRITVIDKEGKEAYTNAYFLDEIIKDYEN